MSQGRHRLETHARARLLHGALLLLALLTSGCGEKPLTTVSSEQEAIEVITKLRERGVKAEKHETGESSARRWNIVVGGADYDFANQLLRYYELPRGDEKVQEASPFQTESERRERELGEGKKRIERHLRETLGVVRVSVLISPPEASYRPNPAPAKADVTITHRDPDPPVTVEEVRQKVANGYTGLTPETVSVKLQFEPPPAVPIREPLLDRRAYTIFGGGLAAVAVLTGLLLVLLHKRRRQQPRQAAAVPMPEPPGGADGDPDGDEGRQMLAPPPFDAG